MSGPTLQKFDRADYGLSNDWHFLCSLNVVAPTTGGTGSEMNSSVRVDPRETASVTLVKMVVYQCRTLPVRCVVPYPLSHSQCGTRYDLKVMSKCMCACSTVLGICQCYHPLSCML